LLVQSPQDKPAGLMVDIYFRLKAGLLKARK